MGPGGRGTTPIAVIGRAFRSRPGPRNRGLPRPRSRVCETLAHFASGLGLALGAACTNPSLAPAVISNTVDTVTLGGVTNTALDVPSGFSLETSQAVFTYATANFDFLYDVDPGRRTVFLPTGILGLTDTASFKPGLLKSTEAFDSMVSAPADGYETLDTIVVSPADRYYLRSGLLTSCSGTLPFYGKLEVLNIDTVANTIQFQVLVDRNCGYHGLVPGLPSG